MQDLFHMKLCTKSVHFCILKQFLSKCLLLHSCWCHFLKALANEDTLLRTHCCRHKCFLVCPRGQHLLRTQILYPGHKKCFWFCSETFCGRSKCFPVCAAQERSWATMCPQQCVLVYQGLKDVRAHCYCASLLRTLFIKHARATSFSSARTESKTQQNTELMTLALTWCADIFVGCSVNPTFFSTDHFLFWLFPLY